MSILDQPVHVLVDQREHALETATTLLVHYFELAGVEMKSDMRGEIRSMCESLAFAGEISVELRRRKMVYDPRTTP